MAARGISTDGGPPAWAVESCCLDGRVGLAKQQGKRVAHRLSKWPTDVEMDGSFYAMYSFFNWGFALLVAYCSAILNVFSQCYTVLPFLPLNLLITMPVHSMCVV